VKIKTEQGRTVNSAREELERGVEEVTTEIDNWEQLLRGAPGRFPDVERQLHHRMGQLADLVVGGLLAEVSVEGVSDENINEAREMALQEGNPLKAPMRHYAIKVALLSGLILCLRVVYCPSDKRKRDELIAAGLLPQDAPKQGMHVELAKF
jgi:hypothetical protein